MGWFDDQIKERKRLDDEVFSDSFVNIAGAVIGKKIYSQISSSSLHAKDAIEEILKYYNVKIREIPNSISDINEQLEYLLRPYGIMRRTVKLEKGWQKDAVGAMLAVKKSDESIVALIPRATVGYSYFDYEKGRTIFIDDKIADEFDDEAIAFYKPFPMRKMNIMDLIKYMIGTISASDIALYIISMLVVTFVGLLIPKLNGVLYNNVINNKDYQLLAVTAIFILSVTLSNILFGMIKTLLETRLSTKLSIAVEAATMMRVLSLPAQFFKKYSAGNLSTRVAYMNTLSNMILSSVVSTGLSSVFSLVYVTQIFRFAPGLVVPSLAIVLLSTVLSIASTLARMKINEKTMQLGANESGLSYALITGVQKIKLSGAEKRAFSRWGELYSKQAQLTYNPPLFIKAGTTLATAISLIGTLVLYTQAIESGVSAGDYAAFTSAFAMISTAFAQLTSVVTNIAQIKPISEMIKPIMEAEPEVSEGKTVITKLNGGIELNNVSFRYSDETPMVIDDFSLKIKPGEYLAIVGKTGCGKSTLVRLLLGFEKPKSGGIYYDGKDLSTIDLKSLRRKIGVVMQEGKLFQGDIFSNIIISAPQLTLDDAWAAAELAGIDEDIRRMPMSMNTIVSEGSGGISGGQRQRLMIARAVAPKPKILIFDEATSALDNLTQKKVSNALDDLKCTRIVIAHRLSTIKNCDRIICLDKGNIIESGTYDELIAKKGFFAELVERQRVDV